WLSMGLCCCMYRNPPATKNPPSSMRGRPSGSQEKNSGGACSTADTTWALDLSGAASSPNSTSNSRRLRANCLIPSSSMTPLPCENELSISLDWSKSAAGRVGPPSPVSVQNLSSVSLVDGELGVITDPPFLSSAKFSSTFYGICLTRTWEESTIG